jgi:hypothetical protein
MITFPPFVSSEVEKRSSPQQRFSTALEANGALNA